MAHRDQAGGRAMGMGKGKVVGPMGGGKLGMIGMDRALGSNVVTGMVEGMGMALADMLRMGMEMGMEPCWVGTTLMTRFRP